jgi:hypothetical protein
VPQTGELAHRSTFQLGFNGFMNAYMLTGNDRYLDPWRKQFSIVNANAKTVSGKRVYPQKYGDEGWYNFQPSPWAPYALELYYLSMKSSDRKFVPSNSWLDYLDGDNATYPETALRRDLARIRDRVKGMRADTTTPDTRLSDDPMKFNPCSVSSLIELMLGGLHPGHRGSILFSRLRYFDPVHRRSGLPDDVAALVERLSDNEVTLTLVNTSQTESHELIVQAGAYAEHRFESIRMTNETIAIQDSRLTVRLSPGCGQRLVLKMNRYVNQPTMSHPWDD